MSAYTQRDRELILIVVVALIVISVATILAVALVSVAGPEGNMMGNGNGWGSMMGYGGGWGAVLVLFALVTISAAIISALLLLLEPRTDRPSAAPPAP